MQNRYEKKFEELAKAGQKAFIPYTLLGYPNKEICMRSMETLIDSGASALELGLAFSDPLADGPIIQAATAKVLESGFKVRDAFELIADIRRRDDAIPITLMCYYNTVLARGIASFCKNAKEAGVDGILVVDLPPSESALLSKECNKNALCQIFIVSPLTSAERLEEISRLASGFIYTVSRLGITGVDERYENSLPQLIELTKRVTKLPVVVGFGISSPANASVMYEVGADGVITGSKIIQLLGTVKSDTETLEELFQFSESMVLSSKSLSGKEKTYA